MKKDKVIGVLLLVLAAATIVGMLLRNNNFWLVYNFVTIILSGVIGIGLLTQK